MKNTDYWIAQLKLERHPEGGWYRQTYRSGIKIAHSALPPQFKGARPASTAIYFLLDGSNFSAFHRLQADELWHFYTGTTLVIHTIDSNSQHSEILLGGDLDSGESFQAVIKAGCWLAACVKDPSSFALVGCTMAPGFDFEDFELGERAQLAAQFPRHRALIEKLTRA